MGYGMDEDWEPDIRDCPGYVPNEYDLFCEYHEIDDQDYQKLGSGQKAQMWWNFRMFGKHST